MKPIDICREQVLGGLTGLLRACENNPKTENTDRVVVETLAACAGEGKVSPEICAGLLGKIQEEKDAVSPGCATCACPCGNTAPYDMGRIEGTAAASVKWQLLDSVCRMAQAVQEGGLSGQGAERSLELFYRALPMVSYELEEDAYLQLLAEAEDISKI